MRVKSVTLSELTSLVSPEWKALLPEALASGDQLYALHQGARLAGFARYQFLPFDSDVFSVPIVRLTVRAHDEAAYETILKEVVSNARIEQCAQLVTTIPGEEHLQLRVLEALGFHLVDVGLIFRRRLDRGGFVAEAAPAELPVRAAFEGDLERLMEMAGTLFKESRFYRDPLHSADKADELHRRWIRNCLINDRADVILVATNDADVPIGFVTCKADRAHRSGTIDLVAVDPRHREQGVAKAVLGASIRWFAARAREVRVKTQATNYAATRLYERGGFRLVASDLTLIQPL